MGLSRQRAADVSFDGVQLGALFRRGETRSVAVRPGARGAADPMHVVLDRVRQVVVDDALNVGDVDAAGCDVRGNQDTVATAAEAVQRLAPLRLRAIGVQPLHGMAGAAQGPRDAIGAMLGTREHQHRAGMPADQRQQQRGLLRALDEVDVLGGLLGRQRPSADVDAHGIAQVHPRQGAEVGRQRRGEQQCLPRRRQGVHDAIELWLEAHVEHTIGLVEDQDAHVFQRERAAVEVVDEPSGRGHDDAWSAAQRVELGTVCDAANDDRGAEVATQAQRPLVRLLGELARRREDQGAALTCPGAQAFHGWNDERGRLAGAGLCRADDIAPGKPGCNRLRLNRRGSVIACGLEGGMHRCREWELSKVWWCRIQVIHEPFNL